MGWFDDNNPLARYANEDGTNRSDVNLAQPQATTSASPEGGAQTSGGDYGKSNEEYKALLDKYRQGIDPKDPNSIQMLADAMRKDGIEAQVSSDGMSIKVPGYDGGWVDPRQDKAFVEGRGEIRGWADQFYYGGEDFDRLVAEGRNPHTGDFVGFEQAKLYTRDSDFPMGDPRHTGSGGGLPPGYQTGTFTGGGKYPLASMMAPGVMQPWTTPFNSPGDFKAPNVTDDPGYQFRMDAAQDALEKSAATKGVVRTGGFIKDLNAEMQGMASQEYANAWNRALTENDLSYNRAWNEYGRAYDIYDRNQANQYGRLFNVSSLGANAMSGVGAAGGAYANSTGGLLQDRGAAGAQGTANYNNALQTGIQTVGGLWPKSWNSGGGNTTATQPWQTTGQGM